MSNQVVLYDTTLRDGTQGEGISLTLEDKLKIAKRLDTLGIDYVEGGWPGSNPKDVGFFEGIQTIPLHHTRIAAFGSTRRAKLKAEDDPQLLKLVESQAPVITIFGKSWELHVLHALRVSLDENLEMIHDSVKFLKSFDRQVFYDAEHFFDGYKCNPKYTLETLKAAEAAGAECLVLCDTNGGTLPHEIVQILDEIRPHLKAAIGIHAHNDCELAVANSITSVLHGVTHIQGTANGMGERCGNANLFSVIPILQAKMGIPVIPVDKLADLTETSNYIREVANLLPDESQPFVGRSAFAHKAGVHVDAMLKDPETYEQMNPVLVGNTRRMLISELSGASMVVEKAREYNIDLEKNSPNVRSILNQLMKLENNGYVFEGAEGSFELMMRRSLGEEIKLFDLRGFRVIVEKRGDGDEVVTEATIKVAVDGEEMLTVAEGDGPVHALDGALRKALIHFYPDLAEIHLTDFKVRVVNVKEGTAAKVRVLVESGDSDTTWSTIGVSTNIIEASWQALVDSVVYGLYHRGAKSPQ